MNDSPEDKNKPTHEHGEAVHILDLADPARAEDANEFQGYLHGANVSFIVRWQPPA